MESYHTTGIDKKKEIKEMVIDLNNDLNGNHNSMSISGKLFQDGVHICSNAVEDILKEST